MSQHLHQQEQGQGAGPHNTRLTDNDLQIVSKYVGKDWKDLGRKLGFDDPELEGVDIDHDKYGIKEKAYQVLRKWKDRDSHNATLERLQSACIAISRGDIIESARMG